MKQRRQVPRFIATWYIGDLPFTQEKLRKKKEEWNKGEETGVEGRKALVGVPCVKEETN